MSPVLLAGSIPEWPATLPGEQTRVCRPHSGRRVTARGTRKPAEPRPPRWRSGEVGVAEFTGLTREGSRGASWAARAAGPGTGDTEPLGDQGLCLVTPLPRTQVAPQVPERMRVSEKGTPRHGGTSGEWERQGGAGLFVLSRQQSESWCRQGSTLSQRSGDRGPRGLRAKRCIVGRERMHAHRAGRKPTVRVGEGRPPASPEFKVTSGPVPHPAPSLPCCLLPSENPASL